MDFWFDIGMTVLLGYLRRKQNLAAVEKAFMKLFNSIGLAYGWDTCPALPPELEKGKAAVGHATE